MRTIFILAISVLLFWSCSNNKSNENFTLAKDETILNATKFKMVIPNFLKRVNDINPSAQYQYSGGEKEIFLLIFMEDIKVFEEQLKQQNSNKDNVDINIRTYAKLYKDAILNKLEPLQAPLEEDTVINGLPAIVYRFDIQETKYETSTSTIALIKGKENFYQVCTSTAGKKKIKHKPYMDHMVYSFHEN